MKDNYVLVSYDGRENNVIKIKPDLITFSTLIKGHCRVKNIQAALTLHETMLA